MSRIEKSLELNITHEILTLADGFWWYLQPSLLHRYWRPHFRFPFILKPITYATGLPINLEGKEGGYDVCINSLSNFSGGNPRLLFMQFKAGVEKKFNTNKKSVFHGTNNKPNVNVEFDINNNKKRNQHRLLQVLASEAGNKRAVVYVFPRIVDNTQLERNIGNLLRKTSFISIAELDEKAKQNGVKIDDGNAHKFRTCFQDYNKNEVNFFFFFLGKQTNPGGFLGEIFSIRMYRAFRELLDNHVEEYPYFREHIFEAIIRHVLRIGMHFSIPLKSIATFLKDFPTLNQYFEDLIGIDDLHLFYRIEDPEASEYEMEIVDDILKSISKYLYWIENNHNIKFENIPEPSIEYTIEVGRDGIRFEIEAAEGLDDISYSLI